jgi:hypothetical protein
MSLKQIATLSLAAIAGVARADDDAGEEAVVEEVFSVPSTEGAAFVETFQEDPFDGRWLESTAEAYKGQTWEWGTAKEASGKYVADKVSILQWHSSLFYFLSLFLDMRNCSE